MKEKVSANHCVPSFSKKVFLSWKGKTIHMAYQVELFNVISLQKSYCFLRQSYLFFSGNSMASKNIIHEILTG